MVPERHPYAHERSVTAPRPSGSGAVDQAVAIWRALSLLGMREVVLAPGSRSAPLVYALADDQLRGRLRAHVRIDERAAAFTALGISRHRPAHPGAVVTTSGTATAHLHAAVMEAHHARVPLLVLTADRPAELRDTGANQTTRQASLYGDLARFAVDLPAPTAAEATSTELRTAVGTVARAFAAATGPHPGPVHLNLAFRDPLVPAGGTVPEGAGHNDAAGDEYADRPTDRSRIVVSRQVRRAPPAPHPVPVDAGTVVVAGDGAGPTARELAERHLLPLLAEPSSGARGGDCLVPGYPRALAQIMSDPAHPLRPQRAIALGHPTLSRSVVGSLLGAEDVDVVVVDPTPSWPDAARRASLVVPAVIGADVQLAGGDEGALNSSDDAERERRRERLAAWKSAACPPARPEGTGCPPAPPEGDGCPPWQARAALHVWEATGAEDVLVLGSSSLVRDLDLRAGSTEGTIVANRGLAGIDGIVSTATGYALARQGAPGRVRVLIGDLTALHDLTGLVIGPDEAAPELDIIVVDDGGGRIFASLEHAAAPPQLLRRFFLTPHGADIAGAATALGLDARTVTVDTLPHALSDTSLMGGRRMLVVQDPPSAGTIK